MNAHTLREEVALEINEQVNGQLKPSEALIAADAVIAILDRPSVCERWRPIETAPEGSDNSVLLIGRYPTRSAWSDVYQGWRYEGAWARWPHRFPPTHWQPLPPPPEREAP